MNKNHFIFDLDDTLTNSYAINQQLFVETFTAHDPMVDEKYLRDLHFYRRGASMRLQFQEAIDHLQFGISAEKMEEENERLHMTNIDKFDNMKVFEGVPELLQLLKKRGKYLSTCTNRARGSQLKIIQKNNLNQYFDNIISCNDEGHEKPDPYCLIKLMRKYNDSKENYVFVGDSKTDRDFAMNADIDFIIIDHYLNETKFYKLMLQAFL